VAKLLDTVGLGGERVAMVNVSSAMGAQFAGLVEGMVTKLRELGPSPLRDLQGATMQPNGGSNDCR
jgi:F420-non-reducing hydrogenase iron-sulfur subunit